MALLLLALHLWAGKCRNLFVVVVVIFIVVTYLYHRPSTNYLKFMFYVALFLSAALAFYLFIQMLDKEFDGHIWWGLLYCLCIAYPHSKVNWRYRNEEILMGQEMIRLCHVLGLIWCGTSVTTSATSFTLIYPCDTVCTLQSACTSISS